MICAGTYTEDMKKYTKFVIRKYELRCLLWRSRYRRDGKINISIKQNWELQIPSPAMGFCNYSNRPSASTWGNEFLQQLNDWFSQGELFSISAYFSCDTHVLNCVIHWGRPNVWYKDIYITYIIKHNLTTCMSMEQLSCSKKVINEVF